ncbi:hypothetical protein ACFU53_15830 [Streptomyces sp. NPDC057474]|uniref:hypothetical protein n=1 Tax=Streptomyces sp. NPDC057474 TaxID=3346144 RepID=UPI0036B61A8F
MNIAVGSVLNLAPAQPGWTVSITWEGEPDAPQTWPVLAWATVVRETMGSGFAATAVEPVFNFDGMTLTKKEFGEHAAEGFTFRVNSPEA